MFHLRQMQRGTNAVLQKNLFALNPGGESLDEGEFLSVRPLILLRRISMRKGAK